MGRCLVQTIGLLKAGEGVLRTGLVSVTFRKLPPSKIVELARDAALEGIEWGGDVHVPPDDPSQAERVAQLTREAGLDIPSYGSYFRLAEQDVEEFEPVLRTAKVLGAPNIRVWAGRQGSRDADAAYHKRVRLDSRRIAEMAADVGLTVSYEFHRNTVADTNEATLALLADVNRANLYTYWQVQTDLSHPGNQDALQSLLPSLSHVHVFHWVESERRLLAEGEEAWTDYVRIIRSTGRDHWLLLEFVKEDSVEALRHDAATLKSLVRQEKD